MNPHTDNLSRYDVQRLTRLIQDITPSNYETGSLERLIEKLQGGGELPARDMPGDLVTMHSVVVLLDLEHNNKAMECTLVFPGDSDAARGRISVLAPLGAALFGARVGDVLEVALPAGSRRWQVESLLYQPEAAGDFNL
jgi:regulator of nucleoside diphosphate kinase